MKWFVSEGSIVRRIWGKPDTILFVFAGAAAEFALNRSVDWLFFTGKLPADPLGRLFSTVAYARDIVFSSEDKANEVIRRIAHIHHGVEHARGGKIPPSAYRDVLYMLIDYSIRSWELLESRLSQYEKEEVFSVFLRVGQGMEIPDLPLTYTSWLDDRKTHMENGLVFSHFTGALFDQYKRHLGWTRYQILLAGQGVIVPDHVRNLLSLRRSVYFRVLLKVYGFFSLLGMGWFLKSLVLPKKYVSQVKALEAHRNPPSAV